MTSLLSNTSTLSEWEEKLLKEFEPIPSDKTSLRKRKLFYAFLTQPSSSRSAYIWSVLMTIVIVGSVLTLVLQTVYDLSSSQSQVQAFFALELFFTVVFLSEYLSRIGACPNYNYLPRLMAQPSWLLDFVAILPFFIELVAFETNTSSLAVIRVIRLLRVFRLFKAHKNAQQVIILIKALKRSKDGVFLLFFLMLNLMFISASFVYFCEQAICERHDDGALYYTESQLIGTVTQFQSIPHALWWAIVTLCTVGYGDM
jgi:Ion transport protein